MSNGKPSIIDGIKCVEAFAKLFSPRTPTPAPAPMTATPDTRPPVEHELKTWASYFHALVEGAKTFELRRDDRGFRIGDTLRLRETDYGTGDYTGRELTRRITHILRHETDLGLMDGFCILSLADTAIPDDWQPTAANINALPLAVEGAAIKDIAAERKRQVEVEGWSTEHDDKHDAGELATAAACYALASSGSQSFRRTVIERFWPWDRDWWKPKDKRRNLVKAGALIVAEIERLDRLATLQAAREVKP